MLEHLIQAEHVERPRRVAAALECPLVDRKPKSPGGIDPAAAELAAGHTPAELLHGLQKGAVSRADLEQGAPRRFKRQQPLP